jgi:protein-S-isoprenylcysteine O-methyltransferase Ste14
MRWTSWTAAIVCFLQLPIPIYWFVLHPARKFWSTRRSAAFITAVIAAWLPVTAALGIFHSQLFQMQSPSPWQIMAGAVLIILEAWIFWRVKRDLGGARLVGATELSGGGELAANGIYARIRHPRYAASFLALVGACLLAGTRTLSIVTAVWTLLTRVAIAMEERELRSRFGAAYSDYCRRVPRFLPR